ncbi:MAG: Fe-S cluster assembly protein SufD [Gemmatimonas sp.]|uniref:Fe-S cluster assembly protein SufD n=1 Tax=Gemmatimonas sp. TaxID=1962908 RepID=UPI00391FA735|nr:Fe-S cluster assembly protein SufD [Gemmatimonadota bacterium]
MSAGLRFAEQAIAASVADAPRSLKSLREAGAEAFKTLGFPTTRNEDWHYTSVSSIASARYAPAIERGVGTLDAAALAPYTFGGTWPLVVFLNGRFAPALSKLDALPAGIRVMDLATASVEEPELLGKVLGAAAPAERDGFTALNAAFAGEGTLIHVAKEMVIEHPVHVLHVMDAHGANLMSHPRHVMVVERHAKASVVESYVALADVPYFTNAVVEAFVEDGATLQVVRIQRESRQAQHIGTVEARQGRDSHFLTFTFQTGAALSRSNVYTVLGGEGCGCTINGLYMLDGEQHGDHQTRVEHVKENCFSREAYKGLIDNRAHGVFNGKVYVHPEAQKTDGKQTNHTLLLSEQAQIDTKPQLEIFADDVKCTHGATVGRMDATALFYLKSRGVGKVLAKQLLMYAFAADVLETIDNPTIVEALETLTVERFTGNTQH